MRFNRRHFLGSVASIALACACGQAAAQDFPSRPIKLVIPQAPGSGADVVGRMLADFMSRDLKQPVVVSNRPGANGIIASQMVQGEPADGYTVLLTSVSLVSFNQFLYKNVPYDPLKDFTFIAPVSDAGFVVVASNESGIKSWADLLKKAKRAARRPDLLQRRPGQLHAPLHGDDRAALGAEAAPHSLQELGTGTDGRCLR